MPALPLSRDRERLEALRRSLTLYRMVFGQNRQEDLLAYLMTNLSAEQVELVMRDEGRHVAFGVNYLEDWIRALPQEEIDRRET